MMTIDGHVGFGAEYVGNGSGDGGDGGVGGDKGGVVDYGG